MTHERSYLGYLGFLGIDLFKSVLMYSNGAICLINILFKMGLLTVCDEPQELLCTTNSKKESTSMDFHDFRLQESTLATHRQLSKRHDFQEKPC